MVDFHLLLLGREEKPHPSLPLCNFCQLTTTLGNIKRKLEKLRDSKKVRKKPHLPTTCKFPVGKLGFIFFFFVEGCQKRDFSHNLLSFKGNAGVAASSILKLFGF